VRRDFDTSHLSRTCPVCGSFERFVNDGVLAQFRAFEASPPDSLEWERLDRRERLLISERVVRTGRSPEELTATG
jgi:hypothetical protein